MSKFNRGRVFGTGPVRSLLRPTVRNHEGALAFQRDTKSELFLFAVSNMVGETSFYERADDRDSRFHALVWKVAVDDPDWLVRMVGWLRDTAGMRSASVVAAAEGVAARLAAGAHGGNRALVRAALR
ncbi:TROVE domain-containing protein, partial [Actinomadura logoneensis]